MGAILPNRLTRQPQQLLPIDRDNPITRGLRFVQLGTQLATLGDWKATAVMLPNVKSALTREGVGFGNAGAGFYVRSIDAFPTLGGVWSAFAVVTHDGATANTQSLLDDDNALGGNNRNFQFRVNSGSVELIRFNNAASPYFATGPVLSVASLQAGLHMGAVCNGNTFACFSNGLKTSGAITGTPSTGPGGDWRLGNFKGGSSTPWNGYIPLMLIFDRALSDGEMASLNRNPWQVFQSQARALYVAPPVAAVGIAFDAASNSGAQTTASYSFNRTVTGTNRYLSVDIELGMMAGATVTGVTDNGVAMTFLGARNSGMGAQRIESWGRLAPTVGTFAIAVTLSGATSSSASAVSYTGVHQGSPTEAFNSDTAVTASAGNASLVVTSVTDNAWIHAAICTTDTTVTAVQTSRNQVVGASSTGGNEDFGPKTPAGAVVMAYTGVGALETWVMSGYALRPAASPSLLVATPASYALTLNSIALRTGRRLVATTASYALTARSVGLLEYRRITATPTSYALTLVSARLARGLRLAVTPATYAVTPQFIALRAGRRLVLTPTTYAFTGQTIGMSAGGKSINALPASYVVTTQAANLAAARRLVASPTSYALTLQSIAVRAARRLAITAATYSFAAQAVNLVKAAPGQLTALTASYALTVQAVAVRAARRLTITPASYSLTPNTVTLTRAGRALQALTAAYSMTANAVALRASRAVSALATAYALTVNAVGLVAGRRLVASPTSYALTARSIDMAKGRFITATPATYTLTLRTAGMYARRRLVLTTTGYSFTGWPILMFTGARPLRTIHHSLRLPAEDRILELPAEDRILKAPPCLQ